MTGWKCWASSLVLTVLRTVEVMGEFGEASIVIERKLPADNSENNPPLRAGENGSKGFGA